MSKAVGRHVNHAFLGASGSGKTFAAMAARKRRTLSVAVDPSGNEEGAQLGEILEWLSGPMADPRRGGHRTWNAAGAYEAGSLPDGFALLTRAMQTQGAATRRRSTLILDEVGHITLNARRAGRKKDLDVVREAVRVSKTGRHTGVSMWMITQRAQELPPNAELECRNIFSVGDNREWRYYEREIGGRQLTNALRATEWARAAAARRGRDEYPYVRLLANPTLMDVGALSPKTHAALAPGGAITRGTRHGGYFGGPNGRVSLEPQTGGGGRAVLTHAEWESARLDSFGWIDADGTFG